MASDMGVYRFDTYDNYTVMEIWHFYAFSATGRLVKKYRVDDITFMVMEDCMEK